MKITPEKRALKAAIKSAQTWLDNGWRDCHSAYEHGDGKSAPKAIANEFKATGKEKEEW